mmetsp:Transcript_23334/g.43333  ORF Transcript_23334/g.43333 Transcript_23334/m.43333 type:complete len:1018 (+) Transcript_23334:108-3161(+)
MHRVFLALVYLARGDGRRLQLGSEGLRRSTGDQFQACGSESSAKQRKVQFNRRGRKSNPLKVLARFLLAWNDPAPGRPDFIVNRPLGHSSQSARRHCLHAGRKRYHGATQQNHVASRRTAPGLFDAGQGGPLSIKEMQKSSKFEQDTAAQQVAESYSWSVAASDAYSWSEEVASNATAAVTAALGSLQYPALLPDWFKSLVRQGRVKEWLSKRKLAQESTSTAKALDDKLSLFQPDTEDLFALALGVAWLLESVGPISLVLLTLCLTQQITIPIAAEVLIGAEALYYLIFVVIAKKSNWNLPENGPATWASKDPEYKRKIWRRMLRDPTQSPRDWIEGWMYREADLAEMSPGELLLSQAARRLGLQDKPSPQLNFSSSGERRLTEEYGVPWEELSMGDVCGFFCGNLYGKQSCADLSAAEDVELREIMDDLEQAVGTPLKRLNENVKSSEIEPQLHMAQFSKTPGIASYCGPMSALRWRHRPLLFYSLSEVYARGFSPRVMKQHGFERRFEGKFSYWYRPGKRRNDEVPPDAFVFIHGIGFGVAPYVQRVVEMCAPEVDILMFELQAASQRLFPPTAPSPEEFGETVVSALDTLKLQRCVVAGHSLGTAYTAYLTHYDESTGGRRVGAVVLIDPIATNLHHARTSREVVFTRLDSAQASFEDYIFKKEFWTITYLQRQFQWDEASYWLDDCVPQTPTLIAVGSADTIVKPDAARQGFGSWKARLRGVRVLTMPGSGHGYWLFNEAAGNQLVSAVQALRQEAESIRAAEAAVGLASTRAAAEFSGVTSKASASLAAATGPFTGALASALAPVATVYEEAVADAERARTLFEANFRGALAEAERSFEVFERNVAEFSGAADAVLAESKVQRKLQGVRGAFGRDYARAAAEMVGKDEQSLSTDAPFSGEVAYLANASATEARSAQGTLEGSLADAASRAMATAEESLSSFERELKAALESAASAAEKAELARVALVREATQEISSVTSGFAQRKVRKRKERTKAGRLGNDKRAAVKMQAM